MKNFDKLQIIVILISMIAIALTAIQVLTMDTRIKNKAHDKYQASIDSVDQPPPFPYPAVQ